MPAGVCSIPLRMQGTALLLPAALIGMHLSGARRVLWSGLLSQLGSFPPLIVQQILTVIQDRVLSLGSDIPASLRAQAFSDTALAQVLLAPCNLPGLLCRMTGSFLKETRKPASEASRQFCVHSILLCPVASRLLIAQQPSPRKQMLAVSCS